MPRKLGAIKFRRRTHRKSSRRKLTKIKAFKTWNLNLTRKIEKRRAWWMYQKRLKRRSRKRVWKSRLKWTENKVAWGKWKVSFERKLKKNRKFIFFIDMSLLKSYRITKTNYAPNSNGKIKNWFFCLNFLRRNLRQKRLPTTQKTCKYCFTRVYKDVNSSHA